MSIVSLMSFSLAMLILAVTPGPGVFTVLGRTLKSGFKKSLFVTAGIITGDLIYLIFALSGLTWLARNMGGLFRIIRVIGGVYLIYLGIRSFFFSQGSPNKEQPADGENRSRSACYLEGLLITLSNPKVILFYCSLLPAFVDLKTVSIPYAAVIIFIDAFILGLVMTSYSFLAMQTGRRFQSEKGIKLLNRGSGLLMAAAGSVMILKR